ncbi:helix-turn-helix domain-containing protein, partial [Dysosmobacter welbionis]
AVGMLTRQLFGRGQGQRTGGVHQIHSQPALRSPARRPGICPPGTLPGAVFRPSRQYGSRPGDQRAEHLRSDPASLLSDPAVVGPLLLEQPVPHPVEQHDGGPRQHHPQQGVLQAHLPPQVARQAGVVPDVQLQPDVQDQPGSQLRQ